MQEWIASTSVILSFIVLLINAFILVYSIIQKSKEPTKQIEERIDEIENRLKDYDLHFDKDLRRIEDLESGTIVMIEALIAILDHGIDGNEVNGLKEAKKSLMTYLTNRGKRV